MKRAATNTRPLCMSQKFVMSDQTASVAGTGKGFRLGDRSPHITSATTMDIGCCDE
jgi:hypothetical protein